MYSVEWLLRKCFGLRLTAEYLLKASYLLASVSNGEEECLKLTMCGANPHIFFLG